MVCPGSWSKVEEKQTRVGSDWPLVVGDGEGSLRIDSLRDNSPASFLFPWQREVRALYRKPAL